MAEEKEAIIKEAKEDLEEVLSEGILKEIAEYNESAEREKEVLKARMREEMEDEVREEVEKKVTEQITRKVTDQVTREVTDQVTKEVTDQVTKEVTEQLTREVTEQLREVARREKALNAKEIAEELLRQKIDIEIIMRSTKLSRKQLEEIQENK